jgi:hypothetical protein
MKSLEQADRVHLNAAEGWFGLGDLVSASDELEKITPAFRAHPAGTDNQRQCEEPIFRVSFHVF